MHHTNYSLLTCSTTQNSTRHHPLLVTLGTCSIACTQCIMTPLTLFCMLTSAPLSNSILTHSTCPAAEAFISAVHPTCNDKCVSSWEYHQCQIQTQYNNTRITHTYFVTVLFLVTYLLPQTYFLSQVKQSFFFIVNFAIKLYLCSETRILSIL